jgi:3-polyprenyl-4-hydroxybenzoate decarboxylase
MARVRVTPANIKQRITDWATSATNRADELIFLQGTIDSKDIQQDAFNSTAKMVIKISPDATEPFMKITFVEILA